MRPFWCKIYCIALAIASFSLNNKLWIYIFFKKKKKDPTKGKEINFELNKTCTLAMAPSGQCISLVLENVKLVGDAIAVWQTKTFHILNCCCLYIESFEVHCALILKHWVHLNACNCIHSFFAFHWDRTKIANETMPSLRFRNVAVRAHLTLPSFVRIHL